MGCKNSIRNEELFNEDVDVKRRFLIGVHISKSAEGTAGHIEGNIQIALGTTGKKKYERVTQRDTSTENHSEEIQERPTVTSEST